ncbi:RusA family crossover junction endodeoxyribonuclease [Streptomyces vilmorinianum]|uniref:RusA family crossover junction endodeoxyribonuclease n=1 Tax=Streptomyces vilmorinianum TaxID=3051092 RepID=UPI0010FB03D6|nr:RusA family crossover junction endodeoxyribonuclease [Streptomyces vilmorinianum]
MSALAISMTVYGHPAPQGSKRSFGPGRMVESSKYVKPWREAVKAAALDVIHHDPAWARLDEAVSLDVTFYFDRPKGHFGTGRNAGQLKRSAPVWPTSPPDLSKLIRSTEDALTDAGVWRDDSYAAAIRASKRYVDDGPGTLSTPGAVIRVWRLHDQLKETSSDQPAI